MADISIMFIFEIVRTLTAIYYLGIGCYISVIYIFFSPISLACLLCFSKRFRSKKWAAAHNQQSSKSSCCGHQQQGAIPVVAPIFENDEIKKKKTGENSYKNKVRQRPWQDALWAAVHTVDKTAIGTSIFGAVMPSHNIHFVLMLQCTKKNLFRTKKPTQMQFRAYIFLILKPRELQWLVTSFLKTEWKFCSTDASPLD